MLPPTKKVFRWFWAWDDDKEEAWLRTMSNQGWHLYSVGLPGWYTFSLGDPQDAVYRLDYISQNEKNVDYFQLFKDAGWDYIGEMNNWQYFRKIAQEGTNPEIFSDSSSKAQKYRRVLRYLVALLPIFLIYLLILSRDAGRNAFLETVLVIFSIIMALYSLAILKLWQRIRKLQGL